MKTSNILSSSRRPLQLALDFFARAVLVLAGSMVVVLMFLHFGSVKAMHVVSDSMKPAYQRGDLLLVSEDFNGIAKNDIIAFKATWLDDRVVTHRVIEVTVDGVRTQGDSNSVADQEIPKSMIRGEVVATFPKLGYLFQLKSLILLVILCVSASIGSDLLKKPSSKNEELFEKYPVDSIFVDEIE